MRNLAPKHAAVCGVMIAEVGRGALAGNDQHNFRAGVGGAPKEIIERLVRPRLRHTMQIDLIVDMRFSRKQLTPQTPVQRHDRVESRLRRFSLRLRIWRALLARIGRLLPRRVRRRRRQLRFFFPKHFFYAGRHIGRDVAPKSKFFARKQTSAGRFFHVTPAFHRLIPTLGSRELFQSLGNNR